MGSLRPLDFRIIKKFVAPLDALRLMGWPGRREPSGQYRGPCPVHGSRARYSRSFTVSSSSCYCHSCKWHGDVIQLWARLRAMTVLEAAHELCERFNLSKPPLS